MVKCGIAEEKLPNSPVLLKKGTATFTGKRSLLQKKRRSKSNE